MLYIQYDSRLVQPPYPVSKQMPAKQRRSRIVTLTTLKMNRQIPKHRNVQLGRR